jgi:hypothetical protein
VPARPPAPAPEDDEAEARKIAWRRLADEALDALVDETGLDTATRAALFDLLEHQRAEIDALVGAGERGELPWGTVNHDIDGVVTDHHEQIRGMLTAEQFELYERIRAEQYGPPREDEEPPAPI